MRPAALLTALIGAVICAVPAQPASGQTAAAEIGLHSLKVGDSRITELVVPFGVGWNWSGIRFDMNSAWASAAYNQRDRGISRISGLTDLTVRMMVPLLDDQLRVIVAGNLPTGSETLGESQLPVAAAITTDLLALPVRSFGSGTGLATGVALARPVGEWVVGGIAVYRMGSAYEPIGAQATEFRPGSEMRMRLALERPRISGVTYRLAGSWSHFGEDERDDEAVFARGDRIMAEAVAEFPFRAGAASLYAWTLRRGESRLMVGEDPQPVPSSVLVGLGANSTYPLSRSLSLSPRAEVTMQRGDPGFGGGDGWIGRLGSGVSYRYGSLRFEPAALLEFGDLNDRDVLGIVVRGGVLWAW